VFSFSDKNVSSTSTTRFPSPVLSSALKSLRQLLHNSTALVSEVWHFLLLFSPTSLAGIHDLLELFLVNLRGPQSFLVHPRGFPSFYPFFHTEKANAGLSSFCLPGWVIGNQNSLLRGNPFAGSLDRSCLLFKVVFVVIKLPLSRRLKHTADPPSQCLSHFPFSVTLSVPSVSIFIENDSIYILSPPFCCF